MREHALDIALESVALDSLPSGVAIVDPELNILYLNAAWAEFAGASAQSLVGRHLPDLVSATPDRMRLLASLDEAFHGDRTSRRFALAFRERATRSIKVDCVPQAHTDGRIGRYVWF